MYMPSSIVQVQVLEMGTLLPILAKIMVSVLTSMILCGSIMVGVSKYLYAAFEVQVDPQAISTAFYKARKGIIPKTPYVNFVRGHGYKITPSGREYIEELLKLKQPKVAPMEANAGSNGATQQ